MDDGATHCPCNRGPEADHADCDFIYGDTIRVSAAELAAADREERRLDIGEEWAEDYARDVARGLEDDDGPPGPYFTDDENREHDDWLHSEDGSEDER